MQQKLHPSGKASMERGRQGFGVRGSWRQGLGARGSCLNGQIKTSAWLGASRTNVPVVLSLRIGRMDITWVGEGEG
jgi:hypothetical protein